MFPCVIPVRTVSHWKEKSVGVETIRNFIGQTVYISEYLPYFFYLHTSPCIIARPIILGDILVGKDMLNKKCMVNAFFLTQSPCFIVHCVQNGQPNLRLLSPQHFQGPFHGHELVSIRGQVGEISCTNCACALGQLSILHQYRKENVSLRLKILLLGPNM